MSIKRPIPFSFIIILLFIWSAPGLAQKSITVFQLDEPLSIDGIFEPEKWNLADSATNFIQMEPQSGAPASERTVAFLGSYHDNIYIVFKCFQKTPVTAKNQSRDALSKNDDIVGVILDTYNDNRTGYMFFVNPLGTQYDMKINDDGRSMDVNWDTEWKCDAKIFEWGWCVEYEIPFKSIKFKKGIDNWGVNFGRIIRSNFETCYWSDALTEDFRISQSGELQGVQLPERKMKLSLFPYISVFKATGENWNADAGGDINWQIKSNISLNSTINPDFATVEADQYRINLTRYELNYPEKRLFFQEGNEMFNTRIRTFYSRRIQDIDFGNRLNGKIGKTQFNILNVKTPHLSEDEPSTFFTAARAKLDFLKSSTLGLTFVDKSWNDGFTRSLSLDYVMNLGRLWKLTGQFVGSAPGDFWSHSAWFMRFARENNIFHYHIRITNVGENFRENVNQTGFVTDDDRKELDFEGTYKFWMKKGFLKYIDVGSNNNIFWSQSNVLRSWDTDNMINFYMKNRFNFQYAYNNEFKLYEEKFYNHQHSFQAGYNTEEWSHAILGFTTGKNYNRDFNLFTAGAQIKLFQNLSLNYTANILNFTPDDENNSTFINVFTANYNFTKDLWVKLFAQNNTKDENVYLYGLLGWRFKPPFGALYLIYSRDQYGADVDIPNSDNFFIKVTYPISILK